MRRRWVKEVKEYADFGSCENLGFGSRLDLAERPDEWVKEVKDLAERPDEMWVKEVKEVTPKRGPLTIRVSPRSCWETRRDVG